ncbi:MAG: cysteine--tRNA ligase, partial [Gammaproteobacteria bacterium]
GGMDLQFPHHENEIAQSEAATGQKFVNVWMHNGFVRINEEKMSKSLGNFFTVREVLERYRPEVIRFFILSSQYRSPLNYSDESLDEASAALRRLYTALRDLSDAPETELAQPFLNRFYEAMDDDFNTPVAVAVLFDLAREINRQKGENSELAAGFAATLRRLGGLVGLLESNPETFLKLSDGSSAQMGLMDYEIDQLIEERIAARENKEWAEADRIRDQLKEQGVILEDVAGGTSWRRG